MKYALGNMLNGAGGLNPDGLSLDLQFAADKTLSARRGPTPTFSRSSSGTFVNANGLIVGKTAGTTSSITPSTQTIGSQVTVTVASGSVVGWVIGQAVSLIVDTDGQDDPDANELWLLGNIVAIGANTLTFEVTSRTTQTGSASSWTLGYRGPRFDHDPVSPFACRGLLIEEGRTNSLLHSANFKNTTSSNYWENLSATTVTVDQIASPDGGVNADLLTTSTTSFDCFTRRTGIFTGSTQYTYSIFLKQGPSGYRYVGLYIGAGVSALKFPFFDFNNPTTVQIPSGTMVGTINSTRVDAYPNGWYRVSVTFTTAATPVTTLCGVYISQSDGTIAASSAAGLDAYIWGIQVELGSFPTSYIPTTTSTAARAADTCNITVDAFNSFYNQSEGTLFADGSGLMNTTLSGNRSFVSITDGTYGNVFFIYKNSGTASIIGEGTTNSAPQFIYTNTYSPSTQYKVALGFKTNDANAAFNGTLKTTDTSVTMPTTMNRLELRDPTGNAGGQPTGHIAAIRYYKKRLANAKLQALTA